MMNWLANLKDKLVDKFNVQIRLLQLNFVEKTSVVLSYIGLGALMLFILCIVLLFLGLGLGEFFADLLDSRAMGYFASAGVFILLMILVYLLRKNILGSIANLFVNILTEDSEEELRSEEVSIKKD